MLTVRDSDPRWVVCPKGGRDGMGRAQEGGDGDRIGEGNDPGGVRGHPSLYRLGMQGYKTFCPYADSYCTRMQILIKRNGADKRPIQFHGQG